MRKICLALVGKRNHAKGIKQVNDFFYKKQVYIN